MPVPASRAIAAACFAAAFALSTGQAVAANTVTAQVTNGTLQVTGTSGADTIVLVLASPTTLAVDVGADGTADFSFDRSTFTAVNVDGKGGDDQLTVSRNGGLFTDEAITLQGGNGDDTLTGGDGDDVLDGGAGADFIDGNRGTDTIIGGGGADTFQWDPGDESDVLDGGAGKDVLEFNGSNAGEHTDLSANGSRVRLFRDVAGVTQDMTAIESVNLRMLGSADNVTVGDLAGTDLSNVEVNLASGTGDGDGAADTVTVAGTDGADDVDVSSSDDSLIVSGLAAKVQVDGTEQTLDHVAVNALGGDDNVTSGVGVSGPQFVDVVGGAGDDTVTYNGTKGDDTIGIANNGSAVATFSTAGSAISSVAEHLNINSLAGNDTVAGQNGISTLTQLTIDGGAGNDTLGGGDGDDVILGGSGADHLDGNRGTDTEFAGGGDDTLEWDPGDGTDVLEGQGGRDVMDFNGSNIGEKIDVSANGSRVRLFRDVAAVTQDIDGVEALDVATLGGADTVTLNDLSGTGVDTNNIHLEANDGTGDLTADTVIVNGTDRPDKVHVGTFGSEVQVTGLHADTNITGSEVANDTLAVNTLGGDDTVTVAPDVSTLLTPVINLGADE